MLVNASLLNFLNFLNPWNLLPALEKMFANKILGVVKSNIFLQLCLHSSYTIVTY